ncbi:Protein MAIN-LIKE 2 [Linum grandiflorum]
MYHGEVSITLQDVAHLTGLSVSGDALYVEYENSTNWAALVQEVLGRSPVGHMKDGGRVMMRWLHDTFYSCADVEDGPELRQYACAYMLSIIRAFLMPDRSSAYVHCQYLLAFRERRPFAWGAAVLSWLYRELGRVVFKIEGGPTSTSATVTLAVVTEPTQRSAVYTARRNVDCAALCRISRRSLGPAYGHHA